MRKYRTETNRLAAFLHTLLTETGESLPPLKFEVCELDVQREAEMAKCVEVLSATKAGRTLLSGIRRKTLDVDLLVAAARFAELVGLSLELRSTYGDVIIERLKEIVQHIPKD